MCFIFTDSTPSPAGKIRVYLLSILHPPFLPHPGPHEFPELSLTLVHSLETNTHPHCPSWVRGTYSHQDPAPIVAHEFWAPEKRDFQNKPGFLFPSSGQPLPLPFPCHLPTGAKSSLGLSLGVYHVSQGQLSAELPGSSENPTKAELKELY